MKSLARPADREELRRRLRGLRPESERRWGRMSVHQMVCHVADAFDMALGRKAVTPASGLVQRTVVKWVALHLPLRWPPGLSTSPEIDQLLPQCTLPAEFHADLSRIEMLLDEMAALDAGARWPQHPIFGRLSAGEWFRWAYLHTDHHLRQFGA